MSEGAHVLIVDDEAQIRRFLRISLEANGYHVNETNTGMDAITKSAQLRPDLIILDLGLPDMDGSATPTATKSSRWTPARTTT